MGHYLTALAQTYLHTGNQQAADTAMLVVTELRIVQVRRAARGATRARPAWPEAHRTPTCICPGVTGVQGKLPVLLLVSLSSLVRPFYGVLIPPPPGPSPHVVPSRGVAPPQEALGGGYLAAFPSEHFDRLEALDEVWAPYYPIHKLMAGG